ncbi:DUF4124 domain-containing protein [Shewanella gelidii]|uniref:DUF4124 domain-containing protein n=1 Tax=Shewanella gelidii TaxID=1642821 RepID=A0A917N6F5_9GAMM|nr:DUF4124 domain-containing protein [Shewanella gelidii]MCL1096875.1 DUF4124 domain-containing protein [Shewanella gelidii]GGI70803.1 hypothetical protein GCM10009332_05160 [Shewanella gelidii]
MARVVLILLVLTSFSCLGEASSIYKCIQEDKIVFSQSVCPKEFRQHKIEYELGITTEIDSDRKKIKIDPLKALLKRQTISKEKLLQLLESEIYRLKQENSYYEILRSSELQKLERKRYWHTKSKDDPEYIAELSEIHDRFDGLILLNQDSMKQLDDRRNQIIAETKDSERDQSAN